MSTTKPVTLSMDSLNRLYFQFFQKFINPNLMKPIAELTQLLNRKTAYQVHRYLEELMKIQSSIESISVNTSHLPSNNLSSSVSSLSFNLNGSSSSHKIQYALPTNAENNKATISDYMSNHEKTQEKNNEESITFKSKLSIRKAYTGLPNEETPKVFQFKNFNDEQIYPASPYSQHSVSAQKKIDNSGSKDILIHMPMLNRNSSAADAVIEDFEAKHRILKDIVRKVNKVFNQNHSRIQKYNKNNQSNKLFSLSKSQKLNVPEENTKGRQYQYKLKTDYSMRKF